jgi:hypothetical protein
VNSEQLTIKEIKIFNPIGECVYQSSPINNNQSTINISQYPVGIYFIQVTDENKNSINRKIIKQ